METAHAFERCGAVAERLHLFRLIERPEVLRDYQVLCFPGGFSYGDDVGAGVIFAAQLRGHLAGALREFLQADKLLLGICNGFQVLMRSGILPGGGDAWPREPGSAPEATLTWNDNGRYTARWVHVRSAGSTSPFLKGISGLDLPIAHGEGRVVVREPGVLEQWRERSQLALCYAPGPAAGEAGTVTPTPAENVPGGALPFPHNPNGSVANIAGLCDPTGRVLGLMPHPERHIDPTQHPRWTRRRVQPESGDGLRIFQNAVDYFR